MNNFASRDDYMIPEEEKTYGREKSMLRTADIMAGVGLFGMIASHAITNFCVWYLASMQQVGATANAVARAFEANPAAIGMVQNFQFVNLLISYFFLPAVIFSLYYLLRRQYIRTAPVVIAFVGIFMLLVGLMNMSNDLSNMIGLLLNKGII
jgi:hypothetical protein